MRENRIPALKNFGPKSGKILNQLGIYSREDLEAADLVEVYLDCKALNQSTSLNLLWAMVGAVNDLHWAALPPEIKTEFRARLAAQAI